MSDELIAVAGVALPLLWSSLRPYYGLLSRSRKHSHTRTHSQPMTRAASLRGFLPFFCLYINVVQIVHLAHSLTQKYM